MRTKNDSELHNLDAPSPVAICGASIKKQLAGNSVYVVFQGDEQQIKDAFNTLWQHNAYSTDEPDWINESCAVTITPVSQFKRGLFSREMCKLIDNPNICQSFKNKNALERKNKAHAGGFSALAQSEVEKLWANIPNVRLVVPNMAVAPYYYRMGDGSTSDCDMTGRD